MFDLVAHPYPLDDRPIHPAGSVEPHYRPNHKAASALEATARQEGGWQPIEQERFAAPPSTEVERLTRERDEARRLLDCGLIREGNEKHHAKIAHQNMNVEIRARETAESTIRSLKERLAEAEKERDEAVSLLEPFADIADLVDAETEGLAETDEFQLLFHDYLLATWQLARFRRTHAFLTKLKEGQLND